MRHEERERELSTADLAAAADRAEDRADRELDERVIERRVVGTVPADRADLRERDDDDRPSLLSGDLVDDLRMRWSDIQAGFVDEPRQAVERADGLVAEAIKRLAESFADERSKLERQWDRGDDVSTEDLRQALQRYRSFFSRLLSV